jgi:CO/xanthine dehydrogenase FAD-binding subunit
MSAAISVGACSAVAQRMPELEKALIGKPCDNNLPDIMQPAHLEHLTPIDDIRAPATYRRHAAKESIYRTLLACVEAAS